MKKLGPIAVIALFATLALSSCKKDYTCQCSISWSGSAFFADTTYTTSGTINAKKNDAVSQCNQGDATSSDGFGGTITSACEIQ